MEQKNNNKSGRSGTFQIVSFIAGNEEYGIDILKVKEIIPASAISVAKKCSDITKGVINLHGETIPLISFRYILHLPGRENNKYTKVILVEKDDKTVGFIIDDVSEIIKIDPSMIENFSETSTPPDYSEFSEALIKHSDRMILLIDIDKVLNENTMKKIIEAVE